MRFTIPERKSLRREAKCEHLDGNSHKYVTGLKVALKPALTIAVNRGSVWYSIEYGCWS